MTQGNLDQSASKAAALDICIFLHGQCLAIVKPTLYQKQVIDDRETSPISDR